MCSSIRSIRVNCTTIYSVKRQLSKMPDSKLLPPRVPPTSFETSKFNKVVNVPCLQIDKALLSRVRYLLKPYLLKVPNMKPVLVSDQAKVFLNPDKISGWSDLEQQAIDSLNKEGVGESNLIEDHVTLTYDNWNADEILRAILPPDSEIARSFSKVGHIVHLNLRNHLLEYKHIIGKVLLDKTPNTRTVVNKLNEIDNTYRNFEMELVCGEDDMIVDVRENGHRYNFDFSKVYWNPRLSTEHQRIVDAISQNDVLFDAFCGVGPFAVPCAKKGVKVFANDLNPDCHHWLKHNLKLNKVKDGLVHTYNKNASDFIKEDVKRELLLLANNPDFNGNTHVTMNLPALALDFVVHFKHLFKENKDMMEKVSKVLPLVHVYFFVTDNSPSTIKTEFSSRTGIEYDESSMQSQFVRNVAPKKDMVKVVFKPPLHFIFESSAASGEPLAKRPCLEV